MNEGRTRVTLRTLLFSTLYPSSARPGHGIFVETRLRELMASGAVETRVVAPIPWFPSSHPRWGAYADMARTPRRETREGIDVLHPRYLLPPRVGQTLAPATLALGAWAALRRLRAEGFDFDLIDAHYFYPDGVAAALLAAVADKPVVITARGSDLNLLGRDPLARRMMLWAARRSAASVAVCQALADILLDWGLPRERLRVLRNGVDLQRFRPQPAASARTRLGLDGAPLLLSVGNLVDVKGHDLTIDALARLRERWPGVRLCIVGEGPLRQRLLDQALRLGLQDHVQLPGRVSQEALPAWYSAADALILSSRSEGWANVLLEAMACGTPVVATDVGGSAEVLAGSAVGVLVGRREPAALAAAVERLLESAPSRELVRRHAEGFGWDATTKGQLELFHEVVAGRDRAKSPEALDAASGASGPNS
jgi:glycosyltransferase involved in cell wall biosynthesis